MPRHFSLCKKVQAESRGKYSVDMDLAFPSDVQQSFETDFEVWYDDVKVPNLSQFQAEMYRTGKQNSSNCRD
jgi:hypothetical protein